MLLLPRRRRKPLRLIQAPLPDWHPDWLELDCLLAPDHLARGIRSLVEELDLASLFDSLAGVGSPAHPPDLLLQLVLFEQNRQRLSPAQWFADSTDSLAARWLLRGLRPARCAFYRFRDRLPQERLDALNEQVLRLAQDEGHTSANCAALDGTLHAAAGSRHHLLNLQALDQRLAQLDAVLEPEQGPGRAQAAQADTAATPAPPADPRRPALAAPLPAEPAPSATAEPPQPAGEPAVAGSGESPQPSAPAASARAAGAGPPGPPDWMARSQAGRQQQRGRYQQARQTLQERLANHERKQRRQRKAKRRPAEQVKICPSEPEAALGKDKKKVFGPLYNTQIVQDVDSPFVLAYGVYATVTDAGLLPPMLERTQELTGRLPEALLTDSMYARLLDARYCREEGVQLYAPLPAPGVAVPVPAEGGPSKKGDKKLGKESFTWLAQEHTYRCPQGHLLQLESRGREARRGGEEEVVVEQFRCAKEHCQNCPQAPRCTSRPERGRTVKRMEGQELLDEVGQRTQSPEGKKLYKQRSQTVERRHADFRRHRGLERFPCYGLDRARTVVGLLILTNNSVALLQARLAKKANNPEAASPP